MGDKLKRHWAIVLLLGAAAAAKVPVLGLPFFWDEMLTYAGPAQWLAQNGLLGVLPGRHPPDLFFGHVPGLAFALALLFELGLPPVPAARSLILLLSLLQLFYTYRIGLFFSSRLPAVAAAAALLAIPTFFAHSTQVLADVAAASLGTAALYYALTGRAARYLSWGSLAVLAKETSLALALPVLLWRVAQRGRGAALLPYLVPLALLALFFVGEKIGTGSFTNFQFLDTFAPAPGVLVPRFFEYGLVFATTHVHAWLVAAAGIGTLVIGRRRPWPVLLLLGIALCYLAGISCFSVINDRYFLPVLPMLAVLSTAWIRPRWLAVPAVAAWIALTLPFHYGSRSEAGHGWEETMEYADVIAVHLEASRFLERAHPAKKIYAEWPIRDALAEPFFGYVSRPLDVTGPEDYDLLVVSESSALEGYERQKAETAKLRLVRRFERNGKWAEVWEKF